MYHLYASSFQHPNSCISVLDRPFLLAEIAVSFMNEWPEKSSLMLSFLMSDLKRAVKYFLVNGSMEEWNKGVVEGYRKHVNKF